MAAEPRGFYSLHDAVPEPGQRYAYALDGGPPRPDPCSRWQPDGVHAPSAVWFPGRLRWDEGGWKGVERPDLVFYELHVGTFTPEGTFDAIIPRLADLLELGITAIELMPVGQFPGTRSWGYDGVLPFAPQNSYGGPAGPPAPGRGLPPAGMAVFLDVGLQPLRARGQRLPRVRPLLHRPVQDRLGARPELRRPRRATRSARWSWTTRGMWIRDYHFDGLRLDAADQIYDLSPRHILAEVAEVVHARGRAARAAGVRLRRDRPERRPPLPRPARPRRATASTASGTTTSTTPPTSS